MIHNLYKAIPGRFKDYISNPKPNGYQSLHTSIIGPYAQRIEIQIRTQEMHEVSKYGVAAHWLYKQNEGKTDASSYRWLQELTEMLQSTEDPEEFLENTKLDLFSDEVFVFTPRGDLHPLPMGATALDFAYSLHSEVGNECHAAKINGRIMPLRTKLQNGDQVEIITKKGQKPTPGWRQIVTTAKARSAINRFLRAQEYDAQVRLGRDILDKALRRDGYSYKEKDLTEVARVHNLKDTEEAYAAIAQGRLFPRQIVDILFPENPEAKAALAFEDEKEQATALGSKKPKNKTLADESAIGIDGLVSGLAVQIAGCCTPLPGEPIVGIINTGRGVVIHARHCKNLDQFADEPDRWLHVKWQNTPNNGKTFVARMRVIMNHEPGALSQMTTTVFNEGGNIIDLTIGEKDTDLYNIQCDVEVDNVEHFGRMLTALRNIKCVNKVERLQG